MNAPGNLWKLEAYDDQVLRDASGDPGALVLVWEDHAGWQGVCWCNRTEQGVKIEEFGVVRTGQGVGRLFFRAVLKALQDFAPGVLIWLAVAADKAFRVYIETSIIAFRVRPKGEAANKRFIVKSKRYNAGAIRFYESFGFNRAQVKKGGLGA